MENEVFRYLKHLSIPVSKKYIKKFILSHPDYPTLLCISDLLENLGLDFELNRVEINDLKDFEASFLLLSEHLGRGLILVQNQGDLRKLKERNWFGSAVIISVKPTLEILNERHRKSYTKERSQKWYFVMIVSFLMALLVFSLIPSFSWFGLAWMTISVFGLLTSYLIYSKDLGYKYSAVEKFCNSGKIADCDKVLNSDNSKVFDNIKFSDLILSFFIFQLAGFFISVFTTQASNMIWILFLASSTVTVPIIFYSLYLQYFVLKSWCRLCLLVSLVLILQFAMMFGKLYSGLLDMTIVDFWGITTLSFLYPIILGITYLVRATMEESIEFFQFMVKASRIKNSPEVFNYLLMQKKKVDVSSLDQEIVIGNRNAPVQIMFVSNLYCTPCKIQHEEASLLLGLYPKHIAISFRFVKVKKYFNNDITAAQYLFQYWMENIVGKEKESNLTEIMLQKWYRDMNIEKFSSSHQISGVISNDVLRIEELQDMWIRSVNVERTPTIFINGFELPSLYSLTDLESLIPELGESYFSKVIHNNAIV